MQIWKYIESVWSKVNDTDQVTVGDKNMSARSAFDRYGRAVCATAGLYEEWRDNGLPPFTDTTIGTIEGEPRAVRFGTGVATDIAVLREQARASVETGIYNYAAERMGLISPTYHPLEIGTFEAQAAEAVQWQSQGIAGPYMQGRMGIGWTPAQADDLAARIVAKKTAADDYLRQIQIARTTHRSAIQALADAGETPETIAAYDYSQLWPPVSDPALISL